MSITQTGFPGFSPYAQVQVKVDNLSGNRKADELKANKRVGLGGTPKGYTWHHHQDTQTMMLIPKDIHNAVRHTGGAAVIDQNSKINYD